jgi:hypothetical protein
MTDISTVFGPDEDAAAYNTIASKIIEMRPRALTETQIPHVIVMIEYMRDECIKIHEKNIQLGKTLDERKAALDQAEADYALKHRALDAALKTHQALGAQERRWWFGR